MLDVPIFAVASAADEAGVVADLLDYLRACGRNEACGSIRIWTLDRTIGAGTWTGQQPSVGITAC